jgi:hypothetical protein
VNKLKFAWKYRRPLWKYRALIRRRREIAGAAAAGVCLVAAKCALDYIGRRRARHNIEHLPA